MHFNASRLTTALVALHFSNHDEFVRCRCNRRGSCHLYILTEEHFVMLNQSNLFLLRTCSQFLFARLDRNAFVFRIFALVGGSVLDMLGR